MSEGDHFDDLIESVRQFVRERDWEQFHSPKNLILALVGEVGELSEIFQWLTPEEEDRVMEDESTAAAVRAEIADVLIYLLRLGDVLGVDVLEAGAAKLELNRERYPVREFRGRARK